MGHAFGHQSSKNTFIGKRFGKKKTRFSGLLFFLSILVCGAFAVTGVPGTKKRVYGVCTEYIT